MGKGKKVRGKNGPKDRQRRREQKLLKRKREEFRDDLKRKGRRMSLLVGPDGKTPVKSDMPKLEYRAGGLRFLTELIPDALLTKALLGAKEMIGQQIYALTLRKTKSATIAQSEAQTAAAATQDPFTMEPAAMAVFMYLSREIEYRDKVIEQISERLVAIGADPINVEHPYPEPPPPSEDEEESESEEEESDTSED